MVAMKSVTWVPLLIFYWILYFLHEATGSVLVDAGQQNFSPAKPFKRNYFDKFSTNVKTFGRQSLAATTRPVTVVRKIVRKPIRDISFWGRALHIYSSYKLTQVRSRLVRTGRLKLNSDRKNSRVEGLWNRFYNTN